MRAFMRKPGTFLITAWLGLPGLPLVVYGAEQSCPDVLFAQRSSTEEAAPAAPPSDDTPVEIEADDEFGSGS